MKKRLIFALCLIGFTAMVSQIVLMRELLIVFYGNELSLGVTLASWLLWVALGSGLIGRFFAGRLNRKLLVFTSTQTLLAFLLPLSIIAARAIPVAIGISSGEIIGLLPMVLFSFLVLGPICVLGGFLFVLGCELCQTETTQDAARIGYVYILEAIGATMGGFIASFFLIQLFYPLHIMLAVGMVNLISVFSLQWKRKGFRLFTGFLILGFIILLSLKQANSLRKFSLDLQWRAFHLLASRNSIYGNVAVTKREGLYSVFTNGLYAFTVPDRFTAERNAHFPLLQHPKPNKVLLVGGGASGILREILKHPVEKVDYVELDPLVIEMAKEFLPKDVSLNDPRVRVIPNMDGRLYIKRTPQRYDVIIINLSGPHTAQLNRFYTKEFYQEVKKILSDEGLLSFALYSNPNYISQEQRQLYLSLKKTLTEVFNEVKISPGETNYFLASKKKGVLTLDWRILMERLKKRDIQAMYMREYYLYTELSPQRIHYLEKRLRPASKMKVKVNYDFRPISYYYDMVLWSSYFKYSLRGLFKAITPQKIYGGLAILYIAMLTPILVRRLRLRLPRIGVLTAVATTGFAEVTFQIVTLLSFQIIYGYVFYKLGIILTSYMLGLIFGGWGIVRMIERNQGDYLLFRKIQVSIVIYPMLLPLLFWMFATLKGKVGFGFGSNIIFPFLPIVAGFIGGFQFPLANKLYLRSQERRVATSAGITYGLDLFGSCVGALVSSLILIPILGIYITCIVVVLLNIISLILLSVGITNKL